MNRRHCLATLGAIAGVLSFPVAHAQAGRIPRVGIFTFGSAANFRSRSEAFRRAMAELGYGANRVEYEEHNANGQEDLLRDYALEFAQSRFDVVLSASTVTTQALQQVGARAPIVMAAAQDPVAEGFVKTLAQPGGNITGVSASVLDQIPRQVALLQQVAPRLKRLTAILNPKNSTYAIYRARLENAVHSGTRLAIADVSNPDQLERAFAVPGGSRDDAHGILVMNDSTFYTDRRNISELAAHARRPGVYPLRGYVQAGGLMSYGPNPEANFSRAAAFVDKVLKGARPADIPVDPPARFELTLNRDAARGLGIAFPPDLVKQAASIVA